MTREQLRAEGVALAAIDYRVRSGALVRLQRGVYRAGPTRLPLEREMAAVLACGESAVLSHRSAARLWQLLPGSRLEPVEVTARRGYRAATPDLRLHRVTRLPDDESTLREGIPVTVPARTLLDLAGCTAPRELERALSNAFRTGIVDSGQVAATVARYPRRAGTPALQALLAGEIEPVFTRSEAEERFLTLIRRAKLSRPEVNRAIDGFEVDFLWRDAGLIVEIDGAAFHSSPRAFERDRLRDAVLAAGGFRVIRVTWRQLAREPEALLVRLAQALLATTVGARP